MNLSSFAFPPPPPTSPSPIISLASIAGRDSQIELIVAFLRRARLVSLGATLPELIRHRRFVVSVVSLRRLSLAGARGE
jgi:hypothetical protein